MEDDFALVRILVHRAFVELRRENPGAAQHYAQRAIKICADGERSVTMQAYLSAALMDLGSALLEMGDYEGGKARLLEAYAIREALEDALGKAIVLSRLAWRLLLWGEYANAELMSRDVIALAKKHRFNYVLAGASDTLLYVAVQHKDYSAAIEYGEQALALYRMQGNACYRAACARNLGHAYFKIGSVDRAVALLREGIEVARDNDQPNEVAYTLAQAALVLLDSDNGLHAARWLGTVEAAHAAIPYASSLDRDQYAQVLNAFRAQLGDEQFEIALAEGRTLKLNLATDEAMAHL
jgi:tetratricopeptide (TPR) repeat protein